MSKLLDRYRDEIYCLLAMGGPNLVWFISKYGPRRGPLLHGKAEKRRSARMAFLRRRIAKLSKK